MGRAVRARQAKVSPAHAAAHRGCCDAPRPRVCEARCRVTPPTAGALSPTACAAPGGTGRQRVTAPCEVAATRRGARGAPRGAAGRHPAPFHARRPAWGGFGGGLVQKASGGTRERRSAAAAAAAPAAAAAAANSSWSARSESGGGAVRRAPPAVHNERPLSRAPSPCSNACSQLARPLAARASAAALRRGAMDVLKGRLQVMSPSATAVCLASSSHLARAGVGGQPLQA